MKKYTFSGDLVKITDREILIKAADDEEETMDIMEWISDEAVNDVDYDTTSDRVIVRLHDLNDAFKFKIAFGDAVTRIDG